MFRHLAAITLTALAGMATVTIASAETLRVAQATAAGAPRFEALDTNKDGQISLNEASSNDDLFVAFKKLDLNRDGELTKTEFAAYSSSR